MARSVCSSTVRLLWLLCVALVLMAPLALADASSTELAAGVAARSAHPPDLVAARAHFEAAAQGADDKSASEALYFLGEMDDLAFDFRGAVAHYEASAARLPSSRYTPRAKRRASELRSHSEGDFAPLVTLEKIRRSPSLADDATTIDALVKDAEAFPPGKVRIEARMLAAEAYAGRLHRREDALPLLRLVADDPKAEVLIAREAANELLASAVTKKDYATALAMTQQYPKLLPMTSGRDVLRLMRRRSIRVVAWGDLLVLTALALFAFGRPGGGRVLLAVRRIAPMALLFAIVASCMGGFLASRYELTSPYPFTAMLPVTFVISLLARASSAGGSSSSAARALRAVVSFAGVFAAAFLMLDRMDPVYLAGFGL